jgi:hypothetical protein
VSPIPLVDMELDGLVSDNELSQAANVFNSAVTEAYRCAGYDDRMVHDVYVFDNIVEWEWAAGDTGRVEYANRVTYGLLSGNLEHRRISNPVLKEINEAANEMVSAVNYRNNGDRIEAEIEVAGFNGRIQYLNGLLEECNQ